MFVCVNSEADIRSANTGDHKRRLLVQNNYKVFFDARASSAGDRVGALRLALAERDVLAGNLVQCDEHVVRCHVSGGCDARVDVFQKCKPCVSFGRPWMKVTSRRMRSSV
jgi:hypothetical protein